MNDLLNTFLGVSGVLRLMGLWDLRLVGLSKLDLEIIFYFLKIQFHYQFPKSHQPQNPYTTTLITFPFIFLPIKGEFFDFETIDFSS
jgi:hypothetical protein